MKHGVHENHYLQPGMTAPLFAFVLMKASRCLCFSDGNGGDGAMESQNTSRDRGFAMRNFLVRTWVSADINSIITV